MTRWLLKDVDIKFPSFANNYVGVGCVIVNKNDEILLVRENSNLRKGWGVPSGLQNNKESIKDTMIR